MITKTWKEWNDFWAPLLFIESHQENPFYLAQIEKKAEWVWKLTTNSPNKFFLELGSKQGFLTDALARLGGTVYAVEPTKSLMTYAKNFTDQSTIHFLEKDEYSLDFQAYSFSIALLFDTIGFHEKKKEHMLFQHISLALPKNGIFIADCPLAPLHSHGKLTKEFGNGFLIHEWEYDHQKQLLRIFSTFYPHTGEKIILRNPFSQSEDIGLTRYLYTPQEILAYLRANQFIAQEIPHFRSRRYFSILAQKK